MRLICGVIIIKKYFFFVGILYILTILSYFFIILFAINGTIKINLHGLFKIILLLLPLFLFYKYAYKIKRKALLILAKIILFLLSVPILLSSILFSTFLILNYPPINEYEDKIIRVEASVEEHNNFMVLNEMVEDFVKQYDEDITYIRSNKSEEVGIKLNSNVKERSDIIEFIINNPMGFTNMERLQLMKIFDLEISQIRNSLDNCNNDHAIQRYNRLWLMSEQFIKSKEPTLIAKLQLDYLINELIELYFANNMIFEKNDLEISLLDSILYNMDYFYSACMSNEYFLTKELIMEELPKIHEKLGFIVWPFFDKNKTFKELHDFYYLTIERIHEPYYEWQGEADISDEFNFYQRTDYLRNPVGRILTSVALPRISGLHIKHNETKSRLLIFKYVVNQEDDMPVDPLTGERFEYIEKDDQRFIVSNFINDDGELAIKYQIN